MLRPALLWLLGAILPVGCGESDPQTRPARISARMPAFAPPTFEGGRRLDTIIAVDLDDDGRQEYVVGSIAPQGMVPPEGRADRVEIYRLDTAQRRWRPVIRTELLWIADWRLRELTGDRAPELVLPIASGGNQPVASDGMAIYSGHGGTIRSLWGSSEGAPQIERTAEGEPYILTSETYLPDNLPHFLAVELPAAFVTLRGGTPAPAEAIASDYFTTEGMSLLTEYEEIIGRFPGEEERGEGVVDEEARSLLYAHVVRMILLLDRAERTAELRAFWQREEPRLRTLLLEEQMILVEDLAEGS